MRGKIYSLPSALVSVGVIVAVVLFHFWETQENKLYILELALPFLLFAGLFYFLVFVVLGRAQLALDAPSILKVLFSATIIMGVFTLVVLVLFLVVSKHPVEAAELNPSAGEITRGILLSVFIPLWVAYVLGGLTQYLLITKRSSY